MIYKVVFNFGLVLITNEDILPKLRKTTENLFKHLFFPYVFLKFSNVELGLLYTQITSNLTLDPIK
jgi:hypothetical protein